MDIHIIKIKKTNIGYNMFCQFANQLFSQKINFLYKELENYYILYFKYDKVKIEVNI